MLFALAAATLLVFRLSEAIASGAIGRPLPMRLRTSRVPAFRLSEAVSER